uniref:Uncharacterized protein n=1 Tax=Arundo donax TaxID=35708 RepID=A0A0A9BH41_ARUDO
MEPYIVNPHATWQFWCIMRVAYCVYFSAHGSWNHHCDICFSKFPIKLLCRIFILTGM